MQKYILEFDIFCATYILFIHDTVIVLCGRTTKETKVFVAMT